ncbi:hypothetical protein B0H13DRAFT_2359731 [Mycena leptocephala]|nr:hypothetical protein B0H13DRAFT_2359731 [Mycena leptocephala]
MMGPGWRLEEMIKFCVYGTSDLATANKSSETLTGLDEAIEAQSVDPIGSKFAVASIRGQINFYLVEDHTSLVPLWTFVMDSSPPRSLLFLGDRNEQLVGHNLKPGPILHLDTITGIPVPSGRELRGGVGSVALSPDRRMKAVHNLTSDKFDLYVLGSPNPMSLRVSSSSGKIKGSAFGEGGQVLVCGGDDGFIHIFDGGGVELQTMTLSSDCSTVYALTTCSTQKYHLIAGGGSGSPAAIYIWRKPTEYKEAIDRSDALEREATAARLLQDFKNKAQAARDAKAAQEAKATREAEVAELTRHIKFNEGEIAISVFVVVCVIFWCARGYLEGLFNKSNSPEFTQIGMR